LADLLGLLNRDPAAARKQFGHSPGLGSTTLFLAQSSGRVTGVDKEEVRVEVDSVPNTRLALMTGLIFGNAVRDATGLIDGGAFSNSQEFNEISAELNRLVETQVLPGLRERAAAGKEIRFAGCFELEDGPLPEVIQIVPIKVEWP
jgi:predicted lipoprotein